MKINTIRKAILIIVASFAISGSLWAQCCGGSNGSPIAGGSSQGVLKENQFEINTSFQFINTNKSYSGDTPDTVSVYKYNSSYNYNWFLPTIALSSRLHFRMKSVVNQKQFKSVALAINRNCS